MATAAKTVYPHISKTLDHRDETEADFAEDQRLAAEAERQTLEKRIQPEP